MRKQTDPWELEDEMHRPVDSRAQSSPLMPRRWSASVRCTWCGRAVGEDWTPADAEEDRLCARCREMVRDPDVLKPGGAA